MANVAKHPWLTMRGSVYYLRAPVPVDIREIIGKSEVTLSLRTKDRQQACLLIHGKAKEVADQFEAHRKSRDLSEIEVRTSQPTSIDAHALQRACDQHFKDVTDRNFEHRADVLQKVRSDPQAFADGNIIKHPTTDWYLTFFEEMTPEQALLACFNEETNARLTAIENALSLGDCALGTEVADNLGLIAADNNRRRIARRLMEAEAAALRAILARDHTRYDQLVSQYAHTDAQDAPTISPANSKRGPTWDTLIHDWAKAHESSGGSPKIRKEWRAHMLAFAKHCGVAPANVTETHVRAWRDKRLAGGLSPITVGNSNLACIRVVFARAIREKLLKGTNPADGVVVDNMKRAARRGRGFSDDEAATILASARLQEEPWKRWVPWLCAFTGSRVSTMMNLRYCDVKYVDGYHVIDVSRDAGPIKSDESERQVPIHGALIADGFLDFVNTRQGKRLFWDETRPRRGVGEHNPGKGRCERLAAWVRSIPGIQVGLQHRKAPSHAWRHWLTTTLVVAGVADRVSDSIIGRAPRTIGEGYGFVPLKTKADALAKVAVPQFLLPLDRLEK